jgi:hypothetical protein
LPSFEGFRERLDRKHREDRIMNATELRETIAQETGFDLGIQFDSEADVRSYFTVETMRGCFGQDNIEDYPVLGDQDKLNEYAQAVIDNRWHCTF